MIVNARGRLAKALDRSLSAVSTVGFVGGVVQMVAEGSKPAPPRVRALAALGFFAAGVIDGVRIWQKMRTPKPRSPHNFTVVINFGLLLAFDRATPNYHHARPWWLTTFAIIILVCLMASVAEGVYIWRRNDDERDRAIANASMAVAFLATLGLALFFALLQSTGVGPTLHPSYVLLTAAGSFFVSYYILRRRM